MIQQIRHVAGPALVATMIMQILGCGNSMAPESHKAVVVQAASPDQPQVSKSGRVGGGEGEEANERAVPISGPTTITQSGNYFLANDITVAQGDGIVITASHVRLRLGEHRLTGPGNKVGRAVVVTGAEDVVVRGGRVDHFGFGAVLMNTSHSRVVGMAIMGGDETADPASGNPPQIGIMLVDSYMNEISENRMELINLGIFVRGGGSHENRISENVVRAGTHGLLGICYNPASGEGDAGPYNDRVRENLLERFATGISTSAGSASNLFTRNTIAYFIAPYVDKNGTNTFLHNRASQLVP